MVIKDNSKIQNLPEPILINNTAIGLLKLFLSDPTREYTILEISKITKINYRLVHGQIKKFESDKTIFVNKKGHSSICKINLSRHIGLYSYIEEIRAANLKSNPAIKLIMESLKIIEMHYYSLILFGSYARGEQKQNSDIDLLFIVPQGVSEEEFHHYISSSLQTLNYRIDINIINESDFANLKSEKSINIRNQVISNHIILYGAEIYYRLIS